MSRSDLIRILFVFWLAVGATLMLGAGLPDPAEAATATEILTRARESCLAAQPLDVVVGQAIDAALASGIAIEEISAPLAETIMEAYDSAGDCPAGAGSIAAAFLAQLTSREVDSAVLFRAVHQMTQGIRAAGARKECDQDAICARIESALAAATDSEELQLQLARIVESACAEAYAETYTEPTGPLAANSPEAPPDTPPGISDYFDPTASASQ